MQQLLELGAEAVVLQFLHSYVNPAHEQRAAEIAREVWPNEYVTVSSEVLREVREFERGSTAAVNAFVQPVLARYLGRLSDKLASTGFPNRLLVMQGNGGIMAADLAVRQPVQTVMSGPAAGAIAAARSAISPVFPNLIACDMGGTSFDVSLIRDGIPVVSAEKDLAPMGAGSGTHGRHPYHRRRRWIDRASRRRRHPAGPVRKVAGATPGPVCYGRGGCRPTVTDANVILGRVDPAAFPASKAAPAIEAVEMALTEKVGRPLGLDGVEAASAILAVAGNQLASAIRLVSIEKGNDPRDLRAVSLWRGWRPARRRAGAGARRARKYWCRGSQVSHRLSAACSLTCGTTSPTRSGGRSRRSIPHTPKRCWPNKKAEVARWIAEEGVPIADIKVIFEADLL